MEAVSTSTARLEGDSGSRGKEKTQKGKSKEEGRCCGKDFLKVLLRQEDMAKDLETSYKVSKGNHGRTLNAQEHVVATKGSRDRRPEAILEIQKLMAEATLKGRPPAISADLVALQLHSGIWESVIPEMTVRDWCGMSFEFKW